MTNNGAFMTSASLHSDAICQRCKFYEASDSTCRFSPPLRLPRRFDESATASNRVRDEKLIWGWPAIDQYDWCGQWASTVPSTEGGSK